jgi:transcription elongation factor Elf1
MIYHKSESSPPDTKRPLHTCPNCGSSNVDVSRVDGNVDVPLNTTCNRCGRRAVGDFGPLVGQMTVVKAGRGKVNDGMSGMSGTNGGEGGR